MEGCGNKGDEMTQTASIRFMRVVLFVMALICMESVMSESEGFVFSVNGSGGNYTNTDVKIKDNHFTMTMRGNNRGEGDMPGIGIFATPEEIAAFDAHQRAEDQ